MLRRNIDVKSGLVNGAIGTVVAISPTRIAVKFDHLTDTRDIEQMQGKCDEELLCVSHSIPPHYSICCDNS